MTGRRAAIGLWLASLALAAAVVAQARFVADFSLFLPSAPTAEQRLLVDQLRSGAVSRVILLGIEGGDAASRARASRALAQSLAASPLFSTASDGSGGSFERERELLLANRYVLSPRVAPARFTVEGLREAIGETVDLLASSAGVAVKPLVTRDPTGELLAAIEGMEPAEGPRLVEGVWASPDGQRALLLARTRASGSDTDAQARAMEFIEDSFRRATAGSGEWAMTLVMTGPGVFSVRSRAMIVHDVERLAAVSMAIVAVLLLAVYRSPVALALGLLPVVSGAVAGIAAVSLGFGAVHGITLGFGTTLIGEAVDYSIYLFVQSEGPGGSGGPRWIEGFWPTIRLGVLTSIAGFSALVFSGLPGLAQLGVYSIAGLVAAAAVTRFVLPALLPASLRIRDLSALGARIASGAGRLAWSRWALAVLALAAALVLVIHRDTLWDARLSSLNPIPASEQRLDADLREALGASDARLVVAVRGASADEALEAAQRVGARLDPLVASGEIAGYESPARFLPAASTQRARLASLPDGATLRERLRAALAGSPLRAAKLEPFIADVERARASPLLTREAIRGTALEAALDGMLFAGEGGWTAILGLRAPIDPAAVRAAIGGAAGGGAVLLDIKQEVDRLYSGYLRQAFIASAAGLAVIVALLFFTLRSPRRAARVMAPLLASVAVVAAWHALAGTRMSLMHLVGLLLVVAIGSNYALFFDRMARDRGAAPRTLASLALANATTVASFGVLGFSSVPVLSAVGSTVALGAFLTLVFALQFAQGTRQHADDHPYRGPS
ncbi:MAG: MMPL family transporter [Usitatibacter sp.]